jgi:hypothetical protein
LQWLLLLLLLLLLLHAQTTNRMAGFWGFI